MVLDSVTSTPQSEAAWGHAKEKTGRGDPLLTIFVRGPTDVDQEVGDPQMTHGDPGMTFDLWYVPSSRYIWSSAPMFLQEQIKDIIIIKKAAVISLNHFMGPGDDNVTAN